MECIVSPREIFSSRPTIRQEAAAQLGGGEIAQEETSVGRYGSKTANIRSWCIYWRNEIFSSPPSTVGERTTGRGFSRAHEEPLAPAAKP
ncbi:hypothetical protein PV326_013576 [Microctonus aethiopoides]|nr:hypothetical protein PV326_013576 [Microctonus aethiopoides]